MSCVATLLICVASAWYEDCYFVPYKTQICFFRGFEADLLHTILYSKTIAIMTGSLSYSSLGPRGIALCCTPSRRRGLCKPNNGLYGDKGIHLPTDTVFVERQRGMFCNDISTITYHNSIPIHLPQLSTASFHLYNSSKLSLWSLPNPP